MKKTLVLLACGLLAGCDYTVPLVTKPEIEMDPSVLGLWQRVTAEGQTERLLVLPLDKHEYMVSYPLGAKDALFARACLCRAGDKTLVQLRWFGTAEAQLPEDNRVFQFVSYSRRGEELAVRLLNTDVVNKDVVSTEELAKSIVANQDKPNLFREDMIFGKVRR